MILRAYTLVSPILLTNISLSDAEPKSKKVPSPYNLFVKAQLPVWKEANPGKSAKEAMSAVGVSKLPWRFTCPDVIHLGQRIMEGCPRKSKECKRW